VNQGTYLPRGLYVVPPTGSTVTTTSDSNDPPRSVIRTNYASASTMTLDYPSSGLVSENSGDNPVEWLVYEFNSTGQSENPGDRLVIATGHRRDAGTTSAPTAEIVYDNEFAVTGFQLRRLG